MQHLQEKSRPVLSQESTFFTESGNATTPGTLLAQIKVDRKMNAPTIEGEGFHNADKDFTGGDGADIPYSVRRNKNRR